MFCLCKEIEYLDLSYFNTSNVKDMSLMFADCNKLKYLNLLNFSINGETEGMFAFIQEPKCKFITNNKQLQKIHNLS